LIGRRSGVVQAAALFAVLVGGCGSGSTTSPTVVKTDMTQVFGIDWMDAETLVVAFSPDVAAPLRLGSVPLKGGNTTPIPVGDGRGCHLIRVSNPLVVSTKEFVATRECTAPLGSGDPSDVSIVGGSWPDGIPAEISSVGETRDPPGQIATNPDDSRQLVALGSLCGVIVEATPTGAKPLPVEVSDGSHRFRLDDLASGPDCSARGWAAFPAWSPDGKEISFFAAPAAMGLTGPARADVPANLYTMTPDATTATLLRRDVTLPRGLDYSPDGRYLAFGGQIGGKDALWVLNRKTGDATSAYDRTIDWMAWAPDGKHLAATESSTDEVFPKRIVIVDAPQ
jgi:hypothetical protein